MKTMWSELSERDKWALAIGSIIGVIYLFYVWVYSPLVNAVDSKKKQWVEKKETLVWMRLQKQHQHKPKHPERNLLAIFSRELKQASFGQFQYQLQQTSDSHIQLSFNEVPYVECLHWLRKLNEEYLMQITELSVIRGATPGIVKLRVVVANQEK